MDARLLSAHRRRSHPARRTFPALFVTLVALLLAACAAPAATPAPATPLPSTAAAATPSPAATPTATPTVEPATFPATLTDDDGTAVNIPAEPTKIVSLTPAATETLFALGVGDRVVGKVQDVNLYPPEAGSVPDVQSFPAPPDVEKILGLGTNLVIAGGHNFTPPDSIAKLRSLGIPVLVLYATDVDGALADIALVGRATGRTREAATIADRIRASFDQVAQATGSLSKPRVFYETSNYQGFWGFAPDDLGARMVAVAGGDPLTSGTNGVYQIDSEKIVSFDPQVIILGDSAYGVTVDEVGKRSGWSVISAVESGAVRPIDDVIVTRPGPRLGEGIRALALAINPDLALPSAAP